VKSNMDFTSVACTDSGLNVSAVNSFSDSSVMFSSKLDGQCLTLCLNFPNFKARKIKRPNQLSSALVLIGICEDTDWSPVPN
jgi:hypothetical protein